MDNLPALFSDLALILVTAGLTSLLFKWLKQPVVLGYIIAGFLIGPYFEWFPVITDHSSVDTWSEIGMVFLLFAIGLEFSFKKLKQVGSTVGITALTELVTMSVIGFFLGKLMGWSQMDSIFLGAMLSISSTTIIAKAFDDLKLKSNKFCENVIGELVVEDLEAVLIMVLLSTVSVSQSFDGAELVFSVLKLIFFILIWFIGGIFLIPSVLKWSRKFMSSETLTVFSVGLCFLMVVLANVAGFSSALGAFIMGSILAETVEADMIHKLVNPIKNLFGAIFFVSVGMLVNPDILIRYWWQILVITSVLLVFKTGSNTLGRLFAGQGLKSSLQGGMCFCQIGEFSFIIATVGMAYGVIDDFLYPIIVSVSIVTTFLTPYSIKSAIPLYNYLDNKVPRRLKERFSNSNTGIRAKSGKDVPIRDFMMRNLKKMVVYMAVAIALFFLSYAFFAPLFDHLLIPRWAHLTNLIITLLVMAPFLWGMAFKHSIKHTARKLNVMSRFNLFVVYSVYFVRYLIALGIITYVILQYYHIKLWIAVAIGFGVSVVLAFASPIMKFYQRIEDSFLENLNKRQSMQMFAIPEILQENFRLVKLTLSPKSVYSGKRIFDTDFRDQYSVSVAGVERANIQFDLPDKDFQLFPYDKITFIGTEEHISLLKPMVEVEDDVFIKETPESGVEIHKLQLREGNEFVGKTLLESSMSRLYGVMVIAVERKGEFFLNPSSEILFEIDDLIWFVGTESAAFNLWKK